MGASVNSLHGTELDTGRCPSLIHAPLHFHDPLHSIYPPGISPSAILPLSLYWEQTREIYAPFEVRGLAEAA